MFGRQLIQFLCISVFSLSASLAFAKSPKLDKYPTAYVAGDYNIIMLGMGENGSDGYLVKIDGLNNQHDGMIYKHEFKCNLDEPKDKCKSFIYETTEMPGKKRWWTIQSDGAWGYENLMIYPFGVDKKQSLSKTSRPKDFDAEAFYAQYLGQKKAKK